MTTVKNEKGGCKFPCSVTAAENPASTPEQLDAIVDKVFAVGTTGYAELLSRIGIVNCMDIVVRCLDKNNARFRNVIPVIHDRIILNTLTPKNNEN